MSSHVIDFNVRNKVSNAKLFQQAIGTLNSKKAFQNFIADILNSLSIKTSVTAGPIGTRIVWSRFSKTKKYKKGDFSNQFRKINVIRQSPCLVLLSLNASQAGWACIKLRHGSDIKLFIKLVAVGQCPV